MSMASLDRKIWAVAKVQLNRPKLKLKELFEWSNVPIKPQEGEEVHFITACGVYVAVPKIEEKK